MTQAMYCPANIWLGDNLLLNVFSFAALTLVVFALIALYLYLGKKQ